MSQHVLRHKPRGGSVTSNVSEKKPKLEEFGFEVAFGLPWDVSSFIRRACELGHPHLHEAGVPQELTDVIQKHVEWDALKLSE